MYAVIETGGKQYRVEVGTELAVEHLDVQPGQSITLDRVLLVADGPEASIGRPLVDGALVSAEVLGQERGAKVIAFKYQPKARRRVKKGHRQQLTVLRVTDVVYDGRSAAEVARKAASDARTERQRLEEAAARQAAEDAELAAKLAAKAAAAAEAAEAAKAADVAEGKAPGRKTRAGRAKAADVAEGEPPASKAGGAEAAPREPQDVPDAPAPKRTRTKKDE